MTGAPAATTVLVDARNVLRSRWPNIPERTLIELCAKWAAGAGVRAVLVFDGDSPATPATDAICRVVATGGESADDWIARASADLARDGSPFWLVTSDRELRARAGGDAERTIGGGAFAGMLGFSDRR